MAQEKMLKFLVEGLTRAFDKQEDCDVMFNVEGKTIGAHRLILNIHSEVLYEMAAGWTPDKDPICIDDISYDSFKAVLRFMYSGVILTSKDTVFTLLSASTHFKMHFLEEQCVEHLTKFIGVGNVCNYMNVAVDFKSSILREKCQELFIRETGSVLYQQSFKELSLAALSAMLDVDETNVVEIVLFRKLKDWMKRQCVDQGLPVNGANMRQVIGNALFKIRFPTMNVQDFANSVTTIKGLLTDSEMRQVFQKISVFDGEDIECPFRNEFRCKVSSHYLPLLDMERLPSNGLAGYKDCSSLLNYKKNKPDGEDICCLMHSFRMVLQCCADLANSCPFVYKANAQNVETRKEVHDEFYAWQNIAKSKKVGDIMTEFMQLRRNLNKLYSW